MNIRKAKMVSSKGGSGSSTFRATLPAAWVREMGLSEEVRDLIIMHYNGKITIIKEEEEMENIIVNISQYEGVKLLGRKLNSEVVDDKTHTKYDHIDNGVHSPYEVRLEVIKENWEIIRADGNKEELEIMITNEYYKKNQKTDILSDKIKEMVLNGDDVEIYGEVVNL